MNYGEAVSKFQELQTMLTNLQSVLAELRAEVNITISDLNEKQYYSQRVKELFVSRNIKFVDGDKNIYKNTINRVAKAEKWRPTTLKRAIKELDAIYEMTDASQNETTEDSHKQKQKQKTINENKLRRLLLRYGVKTEEDFDRNSIIERVILKSVEQKWRKDTFDRNMEKIYTALDKNPLTCYSDEVPELVEYEEPYTHVYHGMTD